MDAPPHGTSGTWVTEGLAVAVDRFLRAGGSLFSWRNNLGVSNSSSTSRKITGGAYDGHPPERPWKVEMVNGEHPITQGMGDFMVTDEQHFPIYERTPGDLLLRGANIDGLSSTQTLVRPREPPFRRRRGRTPMARGGLSSSAIGHNLDALWKPAYLQFQKNAVRWLLRRNIGCAPFRFSSRAGPAEPPFRTRSAVPSSSRPRTEDQHRRHSTPHRPPTRLSKAQGTGHDLLSALSGMPVARLVPDRRRVDRSGGGRRPPP